MHYHHCNSQTNYQFFPDRKLFKLYFNYISKSLSVSSDNFEIKSKYKLNHFLVLFIGSYLGLFFRVVFFLDFLKLLAGKGFSVRMIFSFCKVKQHLKCLGHNTQSQVTDEHSSSSYLQKTISKLQTETKATTFK